MNIPKRKRSVIAFTDALCRLACDTPVKKISVTGICGEAGYTSMAFYSSFENKYDLISSIIDYEARVFVSCAYSRLEQTERGCPETGSLTDFRRLYLTDYFEHIDENRTLYHCILNDLIVQNGIALLSGRIANYMHSCLKLRAEKHPAIPDFTDFYLEITEAHMLMFVRHWLNKIPETEPVSAAELYCDQFMLPRIVSFERDPESGVFQASL